MFTEKLKIPNKAIKTQSSSEKEFTPAAILSVWTEDIAIRSIPEVWL